jgi:glycosyltransferase involved in cell wall biosynthesis
MPDKPCLIFNTYKLRLTDGGPSGFLAQNMLGSSSSYYHLSEFHGWEEPSGWRLTWRRRIHGEPRRTLKKVGLAERSRFAWGVCSARCTFEREAARTYPWIWFHDVRSMAACLDLLEPRQKVILQPHCPQLPSEEFAEQGYTADEVAWVRAGEQRAFARADVCVLPNEHTVPIYSPLMRKELRVEYLMSGCRQQVARFLPPLDPACVYYLYLGRRMPIKGFDLVLEAFQPAHRINSSLRLLLVGPGEPVQTPGVIDIGHSTEPASWLAACDYLVSANRQSYFDLVVLEALSLGTPLIIACTGGHRYFAETSSPGIVALPAAEVELLTRSLLEHCLKRASNLQASSANQNLYRNQFADAVYRARLDRLLVKLSIAT